MTRMIFIILLSISVNYSGAIASSTNTVAENHPIVKAIDEDRVDLVWNWIKAGNSADTIIQNKMKEHLFDRAATHGSVHVCTLFLKYFRHYKMKKNLVDSRGTPILVGIASLAMPNSPREKKYEKIVQNILKIFPESIQAKDSAYVGDGRTALHESAATGNVAMMRILVSRGAKVSAKNSNGETPLHFAARFGHVEAVKYLVAAKAEMNVQTTHTKSTPLMLAAELGYEPVMKELTRLGARQDLRDTFGKTALDRYREHYAQKKLVAGHTPVASRAPVAITPKK